MTFLIKNIPTACKQLEKARGNIEGVVERMAREFLDPARDTDTCKTPNLFHSLRKAEESYREVIRGPYSRPATEAAQRNIDTLHTAIACRELLALCDIVRALECHLQRRAEAANSYRPPLDGRDELGTESVRFFCEYVRALLTRLEKADGTAEIAYLQTASQYMQLDPFDNWNDSGVPRFREWVRGWATAHSANNQ